MFQISLDCPHCRVKKTAMSVRGGANTQAWRYAVLLTCNCCGMGVMIHVEAKDRSIISIAGPFEGLSSGLQFHHRYNIAMISPEPPAARTIESTPINVAATFREAELNFADARYASAGLGYRKAIERALKHLHPEAKGMLNPRIRALENECALPPSMIALLDSVKLLGNESAHDEDDPEKDDVEAARDFTALLLTYLFELPARVSRAADRREKA